MNELLIRTAELGNDLVLEFRDRSNRYYGDYHRILVEIDALIITTEGTTRLRYQRPLKRMGVCGADTVSETDALIRQFLATTGPYMGQVGFAQKLIDSLKRPGQKLWKMLGEGS